MITKEEIIEIIREKTWVEVDSGYVYGIEEAAEKVLQAIETAQQSVQPTRLSGSKVDEVHDESAGG